MNKTNEELLDDLLYCAECGEQEKDFKTLQSENTKLRAMLDVAKVFLQDGAEYYKTDDVNGFAGEICKNALAKIKEMEKTMFSQECLKEKYGNTNQRNNN
jgi:hypothetical protein